jgi:hypothetical protein
VSRAGEIAPPQRDPPTPSRSGPQPEGGSRIRLRSAGTALAVGSVLVVAIALRFLARSDLWLDEALTVNIARLPVPRLLDALRHDGSPPLYYLLLHVWMSWFGTGDTAVRALSGVVSVLALPVAWVVGQRVGVQGGSRPPERSGGDQPANPLVRRCSPKGRTDAWVWRKTVQGGSRPPERSGGDQPANPLVRRCSARRAEPARGVR